MGSGEWGVGDRGKAKQSEDSDDLVEWRHLGTTARTSQGRELVPRTPTTAPMKEAK